MEFRFRASQRSQPPPFLPLRAIPPPQPMPASYIRVGSLVPRIQPLQEMERELHEKRIKVEIIARKIAQHRMLEEEVRNDIEFKHELERYQCHVPLMIMPAQHQLGPRLIGELDINQHKLLQGSPVVKVADNLSLISSTSDVEIDRQVNLPNRKLVGSKRKADATVSLSKDLSCALCQVSMTSEDALNDHLKGKKHKKKSAQLISSKKSTTQSMVKDTSKGRGRKVRMQVNGKMQEIVEKDRFIWCLLCKVKCDTKDTMASHLKGKKHLAKEASRN